MNPDAARTTPPPRLSRNIKSRTAHPMAMLCTETIVTPNTISRLARKYSVNDFTDRFVSIPYWQITRPHLVAPSYFISSRPVPNRDAGDQMLPPQTARFPVTGPPEFRFPKVRWEH